MLIVSDGQAKAPWPPTIAGQTVQGVGLNDFQTCTDDLLIIDVDLLDIQKVEWLQTRLRKSPSVPIIACSVPPYSYRARAQAFALGARTLLPNPLNKGAIEDFIEKEEGADPPPPEVVDAADNAQSTLEVSFAALSEQANLEVEQVRQSGDQVLTAISAHGIRNWLNTVRSRHEGTFQHCLIVTGVMSNFATSWGMGEADVQLLSTLGLLHDIGKVRIPNEILDKPGELTDAEFEQIKTHPVIGYDYLVGQDGIAPDILDAVRHHHEHLDGSGYPDGLSNGQISDLTRILTVCDIYGALVEYRPYKKQMSSAAALEVLDSMADNGQVERSLVRALGKSVGA